MPACEKNVLDIPVDASLAPANHYIITTAPDGTSVLRTVANVTGSLPTDEEHLVAASGGAINNGDTFFIRPAFIGRRVRFIRNSIPQSTINTGGSYYSFTPGTGRFDVVPAMSTGELVQIQAY